MLGFALERLFSQTRGREIVCWKQAISSTLPQLFFESRYNQIEWHGRLSAMYRILMWIFSKIQSFSINRQRPSFPLLQSMADKRPWHPAASSTIDIR